MIDVLGRCLSHPPVPQGQPLGAADAGPSARGPARRARRPAGARRRRPAQLQYSTSTATSALTSIVAATVALLGFVVTISVLVVQRVLAWEASLIDPVGGILGALVFHAVVADHRAGSGAEVGQFAASIGVGLAGGVVGIVLLWLLLRRMSLGEVLGTEAMLAVVIAVAAACDIARDDTGLIAAIVMGLGLANLPGFDLPARRPSSRPSSSSSSASCSSRSRPP